MTTNPTDPQLQGEMLLLCPLSHPVSNGVRFTNFSNEYKQHVWCYDCGLEFEGHVGESAQSVAQRWNTRRAAVDETRGDVPIDEVIAVLGEIRGFFGTNDCWCDSEDDAPHFEHCKAARCLYDRLTAATSSPAPA